MSKRPQRFTNESTKKGCPQTMARPGWTVKAQP
jgi:hypothetical protein